MNSNGIDGPMRQSIGVSPNKDMCFCSLLPAFGSDKVRAGHAPCVWHALECVLIEIVGVICFVLQAVAANIYFGFPARSVYIIGVTGTDGKTTTTSIIYHILKENSRYFLTKFSGSTGDALISQKDIFLFVDGRYYEQADLEVDKNLVTVVKMKLGESLPLLLTKKIKSDKNLAMVAKKNSQGRYEILKSALDKKNVEIRLLNSDPVIDFINEYFEKTSKIEKIETEIT